MQHAVRVEEEVENKVLVLFNAFVPFYRPKEEDGKEDLGLHAYAIRNSSYILRSSFHARVHGDLSVSIRLAFPYECGSA